MHISHLVHLHLVHLVHLLIVSRGETIIASIIPVSIAVSSSPTPSPPMLPSPPPLLVASDNVLLVNICTIVPLHAIPLLVVLAIIFRGVICCLMALAGSTGAADS